MNGTTAHPRQSAIEAAVKAARKGHGTAARHYHVTVQLAPTGDAHHIAVDGRLPMSAKDAEEAELYPQVIAEHERNAARDIEAFVHELLRQLHAEGLHAEGLGQHDTNAQDLINYEFARVTS